jgi:4-carboxymuconolactone decarboxylase
LPPFRALKLLIIAGNLLSAKNTLRSPSLTSLTQREVASDELRRICSKPKVLGWCVAGFKEELMPGQISSRPSALPVCAALILGALASALPASAQERMPPVPPDTYDAAQKKAAEEFQAARKAPVSGPFSILIRIPELMTANRMMGDYLRLKPSIGTTLSELIILITAREWTQDYEWHVHAPIALKQGISQEIVDAIAAGRRPTGMNEDQEICYDFTIELQRSKRVSDATYARALKRFGETGVLDIAGINGYYTNLAMTLNTARFPIPADGKRLPRFPE